MNAEYDKGYQSGYDAGYKRAMLDYGLEDDKPCENREAINELIRHKQEIQNDFGWNTTLIKALDAAIEALKAEPRKDCTKRDAVLDTIKEEILQLDYNLDYIDYDYDDMVHTAEVHMICREEVLLVIDEHREGEKDADNN